MGFEPMPSVEDQNSLSYVLPIQEQGINLESGALDHSAILTVDTKEAKFHDFKKIVSRA